nr:MAG TPA: hypothetical protein [Caudoviricetes sp.]
MGAFNAANGLTLHNGWLKLIPSFNPTEEI